MGSTEVRREIVLGGPLYVDAGEPLFPRPDRPFPPKILPRLDFDRIFGRSGAPLLVDIGAARAAYFLAVAPSLPEVSFLGIEKTKKRVEKACAKLEAAGLTNCRMLWGDAVPVLRVLFPDASVAAHLILFPDPWPKKKHAGRRSWQDPEVVREVVRTLEPDGLLILKSDARDYFERMAAAFGAAPALEPTSDLRIRAGIDLDRAVETKYESTFRREGRAIRRAAFRKRSGPAPAP